MPFLPEPRRPLTPTSSLHSAATSIGPLFAKLPNELLYDILRLTFGVSFIHIELDYEYAPSRVPPKKGCHDLGYAGRYSTRIRDEIPSPLLKRGQPRWTLNVSKRHPRRWRWFGCNCRRITDHFEVSYFCDEPWKCQ